MNMRVIKMRKAKSLLAVLTSAVTLLSAQTIPIVAATNPLDVNGDGAVTITDAIIIQRYLVGDYRVPDYNKLDVNKSMTIDDADVQAVLAVVSKQTYSGAYFSRATGNSIAFPTISGFTPDSYASDVSSRTYMRYSCQTHTQLSNYVLSPSTTALPTNDSGASTYKVIGTDDRYPAYGVENTGIVQILFASGAWGTGFIVGDHQIATAAHVVYYNEMSSWRGVPTLNLYNENGEKSGETLTPVEIHIPSDYTSSSDTAFDYALITVEEDLWDRFQFSMGTSYNVASTAFQSVPLYVTGIPSTYNDGNQEQNNNTRRLYSGQGNVLSNRITGSVFYYDVDTGSGQSGAPVYTIIRNNINGQISYTYSVLAVHHGGIKNDSNWGARITKYQLQFFSANNPYANW